MKTDRTKAIREARTEELNNFLNTPEETHDVIFATQKEREAEMKILNDREELYHCIPPQHKDIVDIIEASDIASL